MWQRLPAFIREWPILIVGILLIVPLLYFSSHDASSSKSTASALSSSRNGESSGRPTAADAPAPSAEPSSRPAPTPAKAAPHPAKAPAKAPDMSHDRMAAAPSAQTSGQGAPAPTAAIASVIGDVATGKLVFRKCQACHSLNRVGTGSARPRRTDWQEGQRRTKLRLFAGYEGQQPHLGCRHARRLSVGSPEVGPRQQDAVSWS